MIRPLNITIPERFWPLPNAAAITLWPFVAYRAGRRTPGLEAHERYHWYQAARFLVVPWYILYLVLAIIYRTGGRNHPMERRAYEAQDAYRDESCGGN